MRATTLALPVAAIGFVLTGCGDTTSADQTESLAPWSSGADRQEVVRIYESWAGDSVDREAAQVVVAHALNGAYSDCMVGRGFTQVRWEENVNPFPSSGPDALPWILSTLEVDDVTRPALTEAWDQEWERRQNNPRDLLPGWDEAADDAALACLEDSAAADDEQLDEIQEPDVVVDLSLAWVDDVLSAPSGAVGAEEVRSYSACLSEELGLPAPRGIDAAPEELADVVDVATPTYAADADGSAVLTAASQRSRAWRAFEAEADRFAAAHHTCQEPIVAARMAAIGDAAREFEVRHRAGIARARAHWTQVREQAERLTR